MKVIDFDKKNKEDDFHNTKELDNWVLEFKNSRKRGFLALFIKEGKNKDDVSIENRFAFEKGEGPHLLGCLELIKAEIIKAIHGEM